MLFWCLLGKTHIDVVFVCLIYVFGLALLWYFFVRVRSIIVWLMFLMFSVFDCFFESLEFVSGSSGSKRIQADFSGSSGTDLGPGRSDPPFHTRRGPG